MDRELFSELRRMLAPLERKLALVASKAVLELVTDTLKMQGVQVSLLDGEVSDNVEHMQPGGLTHVAPGGAEGVYLSIGGVRDDGVVLALSTRANRPKGLKTGETCVYSAVDQQATILLRADGAIVIKSATKVLINGVEIDASGNIKAPGEVYAMASGASVPLSTHPHPHPMGPTSAPTPGPAVLTPDAG